ncbi:unnamed protein product [Rotaria socialis]
MAQKNARVARFLDAAQEPKKELTPIEGYEKTDIMTLQQSMQSMATTLHNLDTMVKIALRNSRKPANDLTSDESAAIHLYTMQWPETHASVYASLNEDLRCQNRRNLIPWFPYMKLFFTALYKLPSLRGTIWRGVRGNLNDAVGEDLIWWGMSSCTEKVNIMEHFVGTDGERTLFNIECTNGKSIRAHSYFEEEEEVLLLPGTYLQVIGRWSPSKDVHIIHLREAPAPYQTIAPPFETSSTAGDLPSLKSLAISEKSPKTSAAATVAAKQSVSKTAAPAATKSKFQNATLEKVQCENERKKIIKKYLVIGNTHELISSDNDKTKYKWTLFVELNNDDQDEIAQYIKQVTMDLHPTFKPSQIILNKPPFRLTKTGWGVFRIKLTIEFHDQWKKSDFHTSWDLSFSDAENQKTIEIEFQ